MKSEYEYYIAQLEAKVLILERENEILSSKAEENLLLNKAFEDINIYDNIDEIFHSTLESISILLNIQFSGIFDYKEKEFVCESSYALFSAQDIVNVTLKLSDTYLSQLQSKGICYINESTCNFSFIYPESNFVAHNIIVLKIESDIFENRFFVFVNDASSDNFELRIPLFEKIMKIISAKLERIYYQNELEIVNAGLEKTIQHRTSELIKQNSEYAALNEEYKTINDELVIAKEKAEESDRLKTAFLHNMSHEIRTPMNAIMGFSGLLTEYFDDKVKLSRFADIITQRCSDLLNIINDIVDISKIESGHETIDNEDCDLRELFSELYSYYSDYQLRHGKKHITFILEPFCNSFYCKLYLDKTKLRQIFSNLLNNAFKYTNNGKIEGGCRLVGKSLEFYVADTGIGIPADKQDIIFERFSQLKLDGDILNSGTGLGLSIVKGLIDLLGGTMKLTSELNKGTTFSFTIPYILTASAADAVDMIEAIKQPLTLNKTILVVEDDMYNADFLKEVLKTVGFTILLSSNAKDAIEISVSQPIDLVLMDIRLPDMNGYEATRQILKYNPSMKIIAQTAYAVSDDRARALEAGCVDYISKPTPQNMLLEIIHKHLS